VVIDTDPFESRDRIRAFWDANGYSWAVAAAHRDVTVDYRVISQSTSVAVDSGGIIRFRKGYGTQKQDWWEKVFSTLAQN